ncbi:MAG: hypothetical protein J5988_09575 [Eubacterium sp.]|nr:hypothetical protein [Eubacterium sp.]
MKTTMEYTVGNTAIQIVNTGKKIKVIDVRKEKQKKKAIKRISISLVTVLTMVWCCFYVVNLQNTETLLDKHVYALQLEIEDLEHENALLAREYESQAVNYDEIFAKAKSMGMRFPTSDQLYQYTVQKSTAIRINKEVSE